MFADTIDCSQDNGQHCRLDAQQQTVPVGPSGDEGRVGPAAYHHQHKAGQHESQACEQAAGPAARDHAQVDAQFMRLRSGQHLHHREQPVEPLARDPALVFDQGLPDHRDLRNRPPEGEAAEAKELQKESAETDCRRRGGQFVHQTSLHAARSGAGADLDENRLSGRPPTEPAARYSRISWKPASHFACAPQSKACMTE